MKPWAFAGVIAATLICAAAQGAPAPKAEGRAELVQKLADCRKIADNVQRLACYDATAAAFDQAEAKGDIVVVDREQARKVRRQAFGFSMPSISLFEKGEAKEEVDNLTGVVDAARQDGSGKWIIKLKDGATWAQIDSNELFKSPKNGMAVKIRRASLGSYLMSVENGRAFRVKRTE